MLRYSHAPVTFGVLRNETMAKFTIVTPVRNGGEFFERTLQSLRAQSFSDFEYIVVDGQSTDDTLNLCDKYQDVITKVLSDNGGGMYEAIELGFKHSSGKYLSWLNSDDIYYPWTLRMVDQAFQDLECSWVTGIPSIINEYDEIIRVEQAKRYFRKLIQRGHYRGDCLGFIQQESSFFAADLYDKTGFRSQTQYAGDYFLWKDFANLQRLHTIRSILASFRVRKGQISENLDKYYQEAGPASKLYCVPGLNNALKSISVIMGAREYSAKFRP